MGGEAVIACISLHQTNYNALAKLTLGDNRMEYCEAHGYLPVFREIPDMPGAPVARIHKELGFLKLVLILDTFRRHPSCEWAWFLDCDAMVTNMKTRLEDIAALAPSKESLVFSSDCHGLNAGSILVPNSRWVKAHLGWILAEQDRWPHEQAAFQEMRTRSYVGSDSVILPQRTMNSYDYTLYPDARPAPGFEGCVRYGQWEPGDFVIHWPGRTLEQRLGHYAQYAKGVVK